MRNNNVPYLLSIYDNSYYDVFGLSLYKFYNYNFLDE